MSVLDLTGVVPIYQNAIDSIIDQMGKNVTLYFKPTVTGSTASNTDGIRGESKLPSFKQGTPTVTQNTMVVKCLIKYNPKDFNSFGVNANIPNGLMRLKTFLSYLPDLRRCEFVVPNSDVEDMIKTKYKLAREPIPIGLQEDRYCVTFWERVQ